MATVAVHKGGDSVPHFGLAKHFTKSLTLDFSKTSRNSADVLQVFSVKAMTLVLAVVYEVITAEGATLTFDVGDADDVDGFLDGINGNAVAKGVTAAARAYSMATLGGKLYTAADTIDMLLNNNASAAKIKLTMIGVDLS